MAKKFYAVQIGNHDTDCGTGSTIKREAIKMANKYKRNPAYDGEMIRLAVCSTDDDFVTDIIVIREGR